MTRQRSIGVFLCAAASAVVVAAVPVILILAGSDGTEPRGLCTFVEGSNGLLPFNPNAGGTHPYSCDVNWHPLAVFVLPAATVAFYPLWRLIRWAARPTPRPSD